jgi:hypothetical protein
MLNIDAAGEEDATTRVGFDAAEDDIDAESASRPLSGFW